MLHLPDADCSASEDDVLRAMFVARKQVFVDLLRWDVPVLDGRFEIDQFDDEHAIYIVVTDRAGRHLASARLLPTTRPHILADLYASLCDGDVPRGPRTYEVTRFCLDRHIDARARRRARDRLVMGLAEFGLAEGITLYTGVAEAGWLEQIRAFGWRAWPLGAPQRIDGRQLGALAIAIDRDTPRLLAEAGIGGSATPAWEPVHAL
ncbi:N-acyl-L-homoserine lactone synthase [uncultured Sphingopyxis sp.]|uniref:Acyl-homoserine-lactone synthase n=1 Tax=uncultured Sphingopyxis sp. TaxID=310581 RepID=A0A1Y5PX27_9SPHN|nr:acyl-homoserine-lactone synthase [uncultured Sphingopyxis sp.]SBV31784.1 N-acyl-L-homoserine lactone synthase [uncultured Sphingopyxis sp.]